MDRTPAPDIGKFDMPPVPGGRPPQPPTAPTAGPSPAKERLDVVEQRLASEAAEAEAASKPLEAYETQLKEAGITRAEAARIVDAVIVSGCYEEEFPITSRVKGAFRTRATRDIRRAHMRLEAERPAFDAHYQIALSRYLLAASLSKFGSNKFEFPSGSYDEIEKAYEARLAFVDALSEPALNILFKKLSRFDFKVTVALQEGAIENF